MADSFEKRQRERRKAQKKREKELRKQLRQENRDSGHGDVAGGADEADGGGRPPHPDGEDAEAPAKDEEVG